jgi:uncharacterized membrane protein
VRLKTALSTFAAASAVICLEFLIRPGFWIRLYGATADAQAAFLYRLIGALFGGLAVMAWLGRSYSASPSREAMVRGLTVTNVLLAVIAVSGAVSGVYNAFAWGPAALFLFFAIAFVRVGASRQHVRA